MRRRLLVACVVVVAGVLLAASPAWAQEKRFEVGAGFQYNMFNSGFEVDPSFGWHARFDWYFKPRWAVGLYYESTSGSVLPSATAWSNFSSDTDFFWSMGRESVMSRSHTPTQSTMTK